MYFAHVYFKRKIGKYSLLCLYKSSDVFLEQSDCKLPYSCLSDNRGRDWSKI